MSGNELTILVALAAGLLSFLSPCVLPLVPAYLGQLTRVAVAASAAGTPPSRLTAFRHAAAYVAGFGLVFTLLGVTATFAGGALGAYLPDLRRIGGLVLVVMGLNLAGFLTIARLQRTWRPLERGAQRALATSGDGTVVLAEPGRSARASGGLVERVGGRLAGGRFSWLASFGLGVVFAIGWTPCIGTILGGILTLAATSGTAAQGAALLVGYTLGLGIPFLVLGALYDRAPALLRPLVRHGQAVSVVGGLLVSAIGVAMFFGLLTLLPQWFTFNTAI